MLLLFGSAASSGLFARPDTHRESARHHSGDSGIPLVYSVETTGAHYPEPGFQDFGHLPIIRPLPDPFRFSNRTRDTSFRNWERRRNEIKAAIEKYEIGRVPDGSDCTTTATYTPPADGSAQGSLTVVVTRKSNGKSLTLTSRVYIPQGMGDGPFPALIPMSLAFPQFGYYPPIPNYGSLPSGVFASRPIATIDFFHDQVTLYDLFGSTDHSSDPFYQLYPELKAPGGPGESNSGQYAAWAWGVSRLIDGIKIATHQAVDPLPIDLKHLAVTGCSYAGKMALFAGAFDERVALTSPQESGGGGATAWRVSQEIEADLVVESLTHTDRKWFAGQLFQFSNNNLYNLPDDHHELMGMVAPRALLETGNTDYNWLSNRANYVAARATQRIYKTFGIGDRFGFYIDGGHAHCATLPAEAPAIAAFVDKFLLGDASADTDVEVNPYPTLDYQRWTWWWGKGRPVFPNNWNPGDGTVVMSSTRPIDFAHWRGGTGHSGTGHSNFPDHGGFDDGHGKWFAPPLYVAAGDAVLAGYDLSMPHSHPAATALLMGANVQVDIFSPDGSSYTLTIPLPGQDFSIPANDDSWFPSPNPRSPLVYQGSATADQGGVVTDTYFSALGVNTGNVGDAAGPGLTSDALNPLKVRFHVRDSDRRSGGSWSPAETVEDNSQ
jgi:hypothetical protein